LKFRGERIAKQEEFSRPDMVEDHGSDYVLMLNIIRT